MQIFIYKSDEPIIYKDKCVAKLDDVITVNPGHCRNISIGYNFQDVPDDLWNKIMENSEEYNSKLSLTEKERNFSLFLQNLSDNVIREIFILNADLISKLDSLGIFNLSSDNTRNYNIGQSNYSKHIIQPWAVWQDYDLNPWDADIVKRILRTKCENGMSENQSRALDYKKIIHICKERLRQLKGSTFSW